MEISNTSLIQIIGQKEVELYACRERIRQLQAEIEKLKEAADADVSDKEGR